MVRNSSRQLVVVLGSEHMSGMCKLPQKEEEQLSWKESDVLDSHHQFVSLLCSFTVKGEEW